MTENMDNFTDDASPKAGVPTGSGAVEALRTKFELLGYFAKFIPSSQLDMRGLSAIDGSCGCVIAHASAQGVMPHEGLHGVITTDEWRWLFNAPSLNQTEVYPIPTGQRAKDEFLRRLAALEAKYAGETPPLQVGTSAQAESPGDEAQGQKP